MPDLWGTNLYPAGGIESFVRDLLLLTWVMYSVKTVEGDVTAVCVLVVKFVGQVTFVPARLAIKLTLS